MKNQQENTLRSKEYLYSIIKHLLCKDCLQNIPSISLIQSYNKAMLLNFKCSCRDDSQSMTIQAFIDTINSIDDQHETDIDIESILQTQQEEYDFSNQEKDIIIINSFFSELEIKTKEFLDGILEKPQSDYLLESKIKLMTAYDSITSINKDLREIYNYFYSIARTLSKYNLKCLQMTHFFNSITVETQYLLLLNQKYDHQRENWIEILKNSFLYLPKTKPLECITSTMKSHKFGISHISQLSPHLIISCSLHQVKLWTIARIKKKTSIDLMQTFRGDYSTQSFFITKNEEVFYQTYDHIVKLSVNEKMKPLYFSIKYDLSICGIYSINAIIELNDNYLLVKSQGKFCILDVNTMSVVKIIDFPKGDWNFMQCHLLHLDNGIFLDCRSNGKILIWNSMTGEIVTYMTISPSIIGAKPIDLEKAMINTIGLIEGVEIVIYTKYTFECLGRLKGHTDVINNILLLNNHEQLASCSEDKTLRIWNLNDYSCYLSLFLSQITTLSLSTTDKDNEILIGKSDGFMKLMRFNQLPS